MRNTLLFLLLSVCLSPSVYSKVISAADYKGKFEDDTELFIYMFTKVSNGTTIVLEPCTYTINSLKHFGKIQYDDAFITVTKKKRVSIVGNGATIVDIANKAQIANNLFSFIKFDRCSQINISDLTYRWQYEATLDPKVEGIIFIRTIDECKKFDVDVSVINAGRGLYAGLFECEHDPGKGLYDSRIKVRAQKVGYSIGIEKGSKLEIKNYFDICHRGLYLAGVTNSTVYSEGKEAFSTHVNMLLTDHANITGCFHCDNIDATVVDTGTKVLSQQVNMVICQTYPLSRKMYAGRDPYRVSNIKLHIFTPAQKETTFNIFGFTDNAKINDYFNIFVDGDLKDDPNKGRLFRFGMLPQGNVSFFGFDREMNYIIIDRPLPRGFQASFKNCSNVVVDNQSQDVDSDGTISFTACTFKRIYKNDKAKTGKFAPIIVKDQH